MIDLTLSQKLQQAWSFVERVATYFDYIHDDVDELVVLKDLQTEAKKLWDPDFRPSSSEAKAPFTLDTQPSDLLDEHGRPYHPDMELSWRTYLGNRGPQPQEVRGAYIAAWYAGRSERNAQETSLPSPTPWPGSNPNKRGDLDEPLRPSQKVLQTP